MKERPPLTMAWWGLMSVSILVLILVVVWFYQRQSLMAIIVAMGDAGAWTLFAWETFHRRWEIYRRKC